MHTYDASVLERFWKYIQKTETCWLWTGATVKGYGVLNIRGKLVYIHRLSYEIHIGPILHGLYVLHRCDVRACGYPEDLFLGTHLDNIADMVQKKRHWMATPHPEQSRGDRGGSRTHPEKRQRGDSHYARLQPERLARGERHGCAKLTEDLVREMRRRFVLAEGRPGIIAELARDFDSSDTNVRDIVQERAWRHILD